MLTIETTKLEISKELKSKIDIICSMKIKKQQLYNTKYKKSKIRHSNNGGKK